MELLEECTAIESNLKIKIYTSAHKKKLKYEMSVYYLTSSPGTINDTYISEVVIYQRAYKHENL